MRLNRCFVLYDRRISCTLIFKALPHRLVSRLEELIDWKLQTFLIYTQHVNIRKRKSDACIMLWIKRSMTWNSSARQPVKNLEIHMLTFFPLNCSRSEEH